MPVIRGNNLNSGREKFIDEGFVFLTEEKASELNCWATKDDLLFTAAGTIGQVGLLTGRETYKRYVISNKQIKVTLNKNLVNPLFAFYWYSSPEIVEYIKNHNTGSTIPLINLSVVKSLPINLPPLTTQTRIASILSSLDDKIELNRRMNQTLEQMAQALFNHHFVQAVDKSTLKEVGLLDIATLLSGGTPKTSVIEYWDGTISWISAKDVTPNNGTFILETERKITSKGLQDSSAKLLPAFSTVITARGTVGNICLLPGEMAISQSNYALKSKINCDFVLFQVIQQKLDELKRNSYGTVFDTITTNTIRDIKVVISDLSNLIALEENLKLLYSKVLSNLKENKFLAKIRDTLLPKLMSGQINIPTAEDAMIAESV